MTNIIRRYIKRMNGRERLNSLVKKLIAKRGRQIDSYLDKLRERDKEKDTFYPLLFEQYIATLRYKNQLERLSKFPNCPSYVKYLVSPIDRDIDYKRKFLDSICQQDESFKSIETLLKDMRDRLKELGDSQHD